MAQGTLARATPGPPSRLVAWRLLTRPNLADVLEEFAPYGDVIRWTLGRRAFYCLRSPEHAEQVLFTNQDNYGKSADYELLSIGLGNGLLTNEGDFWTYQRRLVQPLFAKRRLSRFTPGMTEAIDEFVDELSRFPDGARIDVAAVMNELALEIVGRALFGMKLTGQAARLRGAVLTGLRGEVVGSRLQLLVALPRPLVDAGVKAMFRAPVPFKGVRRVRDALLTIDDVVRRIIAERRARPPAGEETGDLLGVLLAADGADGRPLGDQHIRDELVTFMVAGTETLANGLSWMWHLLASTPLARRRLFDEVEEVLGDRTPDSEDAERLAWTTASFYEALRLRPPVWLFDRRALGDDEFDGHLVPAGSTVLVPAFQLHRDPRFWTDPEAFDPTRFLPENSGNRPRGAYLPFSGGRRVCVGAGFAVLEATLITAMLAQRFRLENVPGYEVVPETTVIYRPRNGLPMTLHRR